MPGVAAHLAQDTTDHHGGIDGVAKQARREDNGDGLQVIQVAKNLNQLLVHTWSFRSAILRPGLLSARGKRGLPARLGSNQDRAGGHKLTLVVFVHPDQMIHGHM